MAKRVSMGIMGINSSTGYYEIGLKCLRVIMIAHCNFTFSEIESIGLAFRMRKRIVLGKTGTQWTIRCKTHGSDGFRAYYIVDGNKLIILHQTYGITMHEAIDRYNTREYSKPLSAMTANEIFHAGTVQRPHRKKASKCSPSERLRYAVRMEK